MPREHILVQGTKTGLPYSKGLLASSVMAVGLAPPVAYAVAQRVEDDLRTRGALLVSVDELRDAAAAVLRERVDEQTAERYLRWQRAQRRDLPLLVLIGGATGAGKSTLAAQVAQRLGITRIVSTDAVREVMRSTISRELLPALHVSSFESHEAAVVHPSMDTLAIGFLRQVQAVGVGVHHVLERAVEEGTDMIVEGVHLLPGGVGTPPPEEALVVQVIVTVEDEARHRDHLSGRADEQPARQHQRYLDHFTEIRRIQRIIVERAEALDVPTIASYALDATISEITATIVDAVLHDPLVRDG